MRLIDVFPDWAAGGGIFNRLGEKYPQKFPWAATETDIDYYGGYSGEKTISPLVYKLLIASGAETIASGTIETLVEIVKNRYEIQWNKLYNILSLQYDPIENYSMVQTETPDITRTETPNITRTETPEITRTREITQKTDMTVSTSDSNAEDVYGFNSAEGVPQTETNGTMTQRTLGRDADNVTSETEKETGNRAVSETGTRTETETGTRKLTRSGNIGVTTSQQMIESEIELWKWNFLQTVYRDVDSVLTTPVYEM